MKRLLCLFAIIGALVCNAQDFVVSDGTQLTFRGEPYRFVGTNFWYGPILASKGQGGDRQRLCRELDALQQMGVENLRVLVGSDGRRGERTKVEPTLQLAPGVYNDTILDGLDYFMAELERRGMTATLYLNNSWEWSGGYAYYLEQVLKQHSPLSDELPWKEFCEYYSQFSTCRQAQELFFDYVRFILQRTNRYTGQPYHQSPAIFSWQIGNEPRAFSPKVKREFALWIKEAAALIRSLDKNHLISIGTEGIIGCEIDKELFRELSADDNIDALNLHLWPSNWGWSAKSIEEGDLERSILESAHYLNDHILIAQALKKPLVLEEFGFPRDGGAKSLESTTLARDRYYNFILTELLKAKGEKSPLQGVNFWGWAGEARPRHEAWQPGDDYTCDPAHEPQGLYSVFDTDTSTIGIIRRAAESLKSGSDYALSWRSTMIDVSRHFLPIEYLYKQVDALSHFGMNRLHIHLTDAAGWRMEIKSRPRLTEVGAWRPQKTWRDWCYSSPRCYADSLSGFGGYYTQKQLRQLICYALERGVEIVPEIEFPAHSEEVVAAYPEVGYNKEELDMLKPETYQLMRDVLKEVCEVFPSRYIHIGGDEAATQHDIQPEAIRRVKAILDSLGRRTVAWDEALTDNPADSSLIIMVWRNIETARKAAALGHEVILCPGKYCYLDKAQDAPMTQPRAAGGYLPIDSVYALPNPFPEGNNSKLLGAQVNVWTEHIETPDRLESMLWPRAFAIAELGREGLAQERGYKEFHQRALKACAFLRDSLHINAFDLSKEIGERKVDVAQPSLPFSINYNTRPHRAYPGSGEECLRDGVFGGWNNNDGRWQGFLGQKGMDVTLDFGQNRKIHRIMADFMQSCGPDIFFPYRLIVSVSGDGKTFKPLLEKDASQTYAKKQEDYSVFDLEFEKQVKTRYIRLQALPGPRQGWVFVSEIRAN